MTLAAASLPDEARAGVAVERRQYLTLDGLRGVAALSVVVLHTPHFFDQWHLPYSFLAVDLFFILSGFVLAAAYEARFQSGLTPAGFVRLRLIRLYPLYLLGTAIGIPVALMSMKYAGSGLSVDWSPGVFALSLPLSLVMLPTPTAGTDGFLYPLNPVLWTILFEVAVNGLYAVLAAHLRSNRRLGALVAAAAVALVGSVLTTDVLEGGATWFTLGVGVSRMMFSFFCGVLVFRLRRPTKVQSSLASVALLIILLVLLGLPHTRLSALATILLLFPALVIVASVIEPGRSLRRLFGLLGVTSYAVYAIHKPLYQILLGLLIIAAPVKPQTLAPWIGIGYLFLVFGVCVLIDRLYDTPFRRLLASLAQDRAVRADQVDQSDPTARSRSI